MAGRFYRVILTIFVPVFCGDFVWGQSDMAPDAAAVLERYRQSVSWMESVSMKIDINAVSTGLADKGPYGVTLLFRRDHGRTEWRGSIFPYDTNGNADANLNHTLNEIFTEDRYVSFGRPANEQLRGVVVGRDVNDKLQGLLDDPGNGGPLWGRIFGNDHKSVADLLAESADLKMDQETIDSLPCYVLKGTTKYGRVSAWIAPNKGYSALKWTIEKRKPDLFGDKPISAESWIAAFDSVRFQEIDGRFVPTTGVFTLSDSYPDGRKYSTREQFSVSDIQLNPDFDSIGAFKVNLPNGTRVYSQEAPGIRYKWKDGAVVPDVDGHTFEEIDKTMENLKKQGN